MGASWEERSFDVLADARQAAGRLLGAQVLAVRERDLLRAVTGRIDQAVVRKRELGHIDKELEGPRGRWPDRDFRCEDGEWAADTKDGMCLLRSSWLLALEEKVRREEDRWPQAGGRRLPLGERLRWADANRALGRAER
jgi:hypothetical protein